MCNGYFDPKNLENQINPCGEDPENGNGDGSGNGGNSEDNNGGNNCGIYNCSSHKGPVEPDPNWGVGGLSIDNPKDENKE